MGPNVEGLLIPFAEQQQSLYIASQITAVW